MIFRELHPKKRAKTPKLTENLNFAMLLKNYMWYTLDFGLKFWSQMFGIDMKHLILKKNLNFKIHNGGYRVQNGGFWSKNPYPDLQNLPQLCQYGFKSPEILWGASLYVKKQENCHFVGVFRPILLFRAFISNT